MKIFATLLLSALVVFGQGLIINPYRFGATSSIGQFDSVSSDPLGWYANVTLKGMQTNGLYSMGFSSNNVPVTNRMTFTVTSMGYGTNGTALTTNRTIYGTFPVRFPYPNQAFKDETLSGTNLTVKIALSDYIFQSDSNITCNASAGFYVASSVTNQAASGFAVTNNSTNSYPKVIGNWTWPGWDRVSNTFTLRAFFWHQSAQGGRPVANVQFRVTDGTTTVTNDAVDLVVSELPDQTPVLEYQATFSTAPFIDKAVLRADVIAKPFVGDSSTIIDTTALGNLATSGQPAPRFFINDDNPADLFGTSYAVVDPSMPDDTTGYVTNAFNSAGPPIPYKTMSGAATALKAYNNSNYSRNDAAGSFVVLTNGIHNWGGASYTVPSGSTSTQLWVNFVGYPGSAVSDIIITNFVTTQNLGRRVKLQGVKIMANNNTGMINATSSGVAGAVWFDRCEIDSATSSSILVNDAGWWAITHSRLIEMRQGFRGASGINCAAALFRGNNLDGYSRNSMAFMAIGNLRTNTATPNATLFITYTGNASNPVATNGVLAFNRIYAWNSSTVGAHTLWNTETNLWGGAVIQNIFESVNDGSFGLSSLASSTPSGTSRNINYVHNTHTGAKNQFWYNDTGTASIIRDQTLSVNNIYDDYNIKTDTFNAPPDGARVGNWPAMWSAGHSGDLIAEINGLGAAGSFMPDFPGINTYTPGYTGIESTSTGTTNITKFVAQRSFNGVSNGAGNGDYRLQSGSVAIGLPRRFVLPYDIAGNPRTSGDASGAYTYP